jgi:hypothetical protein
MPVLEYQSPTSRPRVDWSERYRRCVPRFALGYVMVGVAWAIESLPYVHWDGPLYHRVFTLIVVFPAIYALCPIFGLVGFIVGGSINALLWGFAAVGLWHFASVARSKLRARSQ